MAGDGKDPILDFMVVRAPERVADAAARRRYIWDRVLIKPKGGLSTHVPDDPPDPQALERVSPIGRIVYDLVFHSDLQPGQEALEKLRDKVLETQRPYKAADLPTEPVEPTELEPPADPPVTPPQQPPAPPKPLTLRLDDLAQHAHIVVGDLYYILPDRLEQLAAARVPLIRELIRVRPILEAAAHPATTAATFDPAKLRARLEKEFGKPLPTAVFSANGHSDDYIAAHRALFDGLYLLYLLRRWTTVDLSDLISGLQLLHAIDALAIDALYATVRAGKASKDDKARMDALASTVPEFAGWNGTTDVAGFPAVTSAPALAELLDAHPVVNPLLARLFWFRKPFNDVTPIGVGDLKVVKQWLTAYRPGEISHIHNIMAGEGAGFGYTRATEDHTRTAQNFARDVVAKAVERVQSQTTSQRTITQTFETVEKNRQTFDNADGDEHISGIYRWVDKEYTAQVYNYGKRMMFEFVVPQPAAFWVESKLRAYENSLDVPQPPFPVPVEKPVSLPFTKDKITETLFASLKLRYDLREIPAYPVPSRVVPARDPQTRGRQFAEKDVTGQDHARTFDCSIVGAAGYCAIGAHLSGYGEFHHRVADNRTSLLLNGRMVFEESRNAYIWPFDLRVQPQEEIVFTSEDASLGLVFNNEIKFYDLALEVELERMPDTLANWQQL